MKGTALEIKIYIDDKGKYRTNYWDGNDSKLGTFSKISDVIDSVAADVKVWRSDLPKEWTSEQ